MVIQYGLFESLLAGRIGKTSLPQLNLWLADQSLKHLK